MSTPVMMTNCLAEETLAEFIDGRLGPEARRTVTEHVASCAECYDVVTTAWDLRQSDPAIADDAGAVIRGRFSWRPLAPMAAAAAAAVIVIFFLREPVQQWNTARRLPGAAASLDERPFDGRLSGDYVHKPAKRTLRGDGDDDDSFGPYRVEEIKLNALDAAQRHPTVRSLHTLGVAELLLNDHQAAVEALRKALQLQTGTNDVAAGIAKSTDEELLTDLAAAYQRRGHFHDQRDDYAIALKAAERAWSLEKTPAAAWNRALALESLERKPEAIAAWQEYLALDSTSAWAAEAQQRIARINDPY